MLNVPEDQAERIDCTPNILQLQTPTLEKKQENVHREGGGYFSILTWLPGVIFLARDHVKIENLRNSHNLLRLNCRAIPTVA